MNCRQFQNKISYYIDEELSNEEVQKFQFHGKECISCNALLSEFLQVDKLIITTPESIRDDIPAALQKPPETKISFAKRLLFPAGRRLAAASLLLLILTAGFFLHHYFYAHKAQESEKSFYSQIVEKPYEDITRQYYNITLNDNYYNVSIEGKEVLLLSLEIIENETEGIVMNFQGTREE